jgi:actin related protein 2/3 complex subunit 1A/1B
MCVRVCLHVPSARGDWLPCRIFGAAIKSVDKKPPATCWGAKAKVGELMAEFGTGSVGGGWIHDVSFSADGNQLAYVSHDSSIYVADGNNDMA